MSKFKRLTSLMLVMVMAFTSLFALSVNAGAASVFSGAKKMKELETYSWTTKTLGGETYYKIEVPTAGEVLFRAAKNYIVSGTFFDAKANLIAIDVRADGWHVNVPQKGTYYLRLYKRDDYHIWSDEYGAEAIMKGLYYTFSNASNVAASVTITENLNVGDEINLSATIANYEGKAKWSVSNKKVATIENGVLKAVGEGKCTVTASIDYDTIIDEIKIVVKKEKVPAVTITMGAKVGDTLDLSASVSNSTSKAAWKTSDSKVATVDNGKVKFVSAGSVIIQASLSDGTATKIKFNVTK